ncbi:olfactory receptor 1500-like [Engystomops pustulosus]|uniref:olfactory receptor 1500-like n=1 Tax=Engystomops pustulosus TaxID=76066 RepID=UPI003AFABB6A
MKKPFGGNKTPGFGTANDSAAHGRYGKRRAKQAANMTCPIDCSTMDQLRIKNSIESDDISEAKNIQYQKTHGFMAMDKTEEKCAVTVLKESGQFRIRRVDPKETWTASITSPQQLVMQNVLKTKEVNNVTEFLEFVLLGFQGLQYLRILLFSLLFVIFCGTICGNLMIIILVFTSRSLHTPMYFFISQLSISDILLMSDIVPNLLYIILHDGGVITFIDCLTQCFFFLTIEGFECFLLTVMSYDRYVAICNPLRYTSIMTSTRCVTLVIILWLLGAFFGLTYTLPLSRLKFCRQNTIDHVFCDGVPLLELTCSDTFFIKLQVYLLSIPFVIIPSIIIIISYVNIVWAILRIPSNISRQKAFSTCSSHLIVVSIFFWTLLGVYVFSKNGQTPDINKTLSLIYTVFTPLVNPIIYSFRNKDMKKAAQELIQKHISTFT